MPKCQPRAPTVQGSDQRPEMEWVARQRGADRVWQNAGYPIWPCSTTNINKVVRQTDDEQSIRIHRSDIAATEEMQQRQEHQLSAQSEQQQQQQEVFVVKVETLVGCRWYKPAGMWQVAALMLDSGYKGRLVLKLCNVSSLRTTESKNQDEKTDFKLLQTSASSTL